MRETIPLMLERILRLFVSVPRRMRAPLTEVRADAEKVSVAVVDPLFVRLLKTVEPEIVWSKPSSVTEPEL